MKILISLCFLSLLGTPALAKQRIVTLSPHLTEWVYSLGKGENLVAVSDFSNYPPAAQQLPRVADYNGADIAAIMRLQPDIILAWQGGNKPQDIARLKSLGFTVFTSQPLKPDDIASELTALGPLLDAGEQATVLATQFRKQLTEMRAHYQTASPRKVLYYMWTQPIMTIGQNAWANQLLNVCGAQTVFTDAPNDYPQVSLQEVLRRQPQLLIAASHTSVDDLNAFWAPHRDLLKAPLIVVDPDITSRFTLRLLPALNRLCEQIAHTTQVH